MLNYISVNVYFISNKDFFIIFFYLVNNNPKKVPGLSPGCFRMPFCVCVEFACSPRVCMGFLRVLRFPPQSKV